MKKLGTKDYLTICILWAFIIGFVLFLRYQGFAFGSYVDWLSQHITIPEYFRMMFYEKGTLLPLFNSNLGMGQNIFYFSYYGLLSPVILISYLLPFLSMSTFIQIASILSILISVFLLYRWINGKYSYHTALIACIIFILAGPVLFHAHRHVMFVIYMPFLLWALISVDNYFENQKRLPLIISTFLMIMTSYYYSVPGIMVIGIYTIYKTLQAKKITWESFFPLFKIIMYVSISILLAGVLLVPTFYTLLIGRSDSHNAIKFLTLFIPRLNYSLTYYSAYSMGMCFIYVIAIIYANFTKKKENLFLGIILIIAMFLPIMNYLLNGLMYLDGKVFIPFIPLAIIIISEFIHKLFQKQISLKLFYFLIPTIIIMLYCAIGYNNLPLLIFDIALTSLILIIAIFFKKPLLIYLPIIMISAFNFYNINKNEKYVLISDIIKENNPVYKELLDLTDNPFTRVSIYDNILNKVNKVYTPTYNSTSIFSSTSNKYHKNFIRNVFENEVVNSEYIVIPQTANLLFNIYSNTEYLIAETPLKGYQPITTSGHLTLYQNTDVLPLGYASAKIMSLREFNTLTYPQTIDALLNYVIVDKALNNVYRSHISRLNPDIKLDYDYGLSFSEENDIYYINAETGASMQLSLAEKLTDDILIISFTMNKEREGGWCSTDITINGINNSLSCTNWKYHNKNFFFAYVLAPEKGINKLDIQFTKGEYVISDVAFHKMPYNSVKKIKNNISPLIINQELSNNNYLIGEIDVKEDGYFKLSIPYEKRGFTVKVDDKTIIPIKVDTAFLGFEISAGLHKIEVSFTPPLLKGGIILSIIGVILFILTALYHKIHRQIDYVVGLLKKTYDRVFVKTNIFLITNRGYVYLFFALFILDISLRVFYYPIINFYGWYRLVPNLFSINWIIFILLLTNYCKSKFGKTIFIIGYLFSLSMFCIHAIYFSYFKTFFDYSIFTMTGEGLAYLDAVLLNIKWWVVIIAIISVILAIRGITQIHHTTKFRLHHLLIITGFFIGVYLNLPYLLGGRTQTVEWDDWRNPRSIYYAFNDNNKSMMVTGMFEYNIRDFYINFIRNNNKISVEEEMLLDENFNGAELNKGNKYTGLFAGKNLIVIQLESIDSFLITEKIMPITYNMMKKSINFTNHYSFTSGGGSTFNSEFMVNIGYSTAYNFNQNAYSFSRNNYSYSLPNLFKQLGYSANIFHMNSSEYYSRGTNYKAFGYDNYFGLKDLNEYSNNEYWLDRELINNKLFNNEIFRPDTLSYIITYSAHMPYKTTKGTCPKLTSETGLTELECLKIQAAETDYFMKLLLEHLEINNMLDNTVIVAFTDHYLYTLEDQTLLDKYKTTSNHLINHTPFFIWSNNEHKITVKSVNSQLDVLPTILNLFGIEYYPNYYLGNDILDKSFEPLVFFQDGSWYNGSTYIASGEYQSGKKMTTEEINRINALVKRKMKLNDAVMKADYFNRLAK